jgi:hypothetical protein
MKNIEAISNAPNNNEDLIHLKGALEKILSKRAGSASYELAKNSNPESLQTATDLLKVDITQSARVILDPSSRTYSQVAHNPLSTIDLILNNKMSAVVASLDSKWTQIVHKMILVVAAIQIDCGKYTEDIEGAAYYYRILGISDKADEFNAKVNNRQSIREGNTPNMDASIRDFVSSVSLGDLYSDNEIIEIMNASQKKIETLIAQVG